MKYLTLSSTGKRMGTTSGSPIHFVGDPCSRVVYVTEGCLKADVAHALMHRTFVATLGVNNTAKLDELFAFLHRNGTEEIIEAEDMDKYSNEMVEKGASKIYALAARHGMRCRRLTWNPNYKGIDDWQLALRRKEQKMKEDPGMTFKEQYLNGLCGLEMLETCTEKWHAMKVDSISLRDYLGLTEQEYDAYLQTDPGVSFRELLDSQRKMQRFRVYQLELEHGETRAFAFGGIDALQKAGFQQPPAAEYTLVYDGELICPVRQDERDILERIFARYNQAFPPDYRGRSIAPSDVLELYDESERRYFYIAKNIVAAGLAKRCTISLAYAIGQAQPVAVTVDTEHTGIYSDDVLEQAVRTVFNLTPDGMIGTLGLDQPMFQKFCNYGHFTHADAPWERTDMTEVLECACRAKDMGVSHR